MYTVAPGTNGVFAICQARAAFNAGQVVVAYNDSSVIDAAVGDADFRATVGGQSESFASNSPAPSATPLSVQSIASGTMVYAASRDPATSEPVIFSGSGATMAEAQQLVAAFAAAPLATLSTLRRAQDLPAPTFDTRAWSKIGEFKYAVPLDTVPVTIGKETTDYHNIGALGGFVELYRLNTNDKNHDYFLVDATFDQGVNNYECDLLQCYWYNQNGYLLMEMSAFTADGMKVEGTVFDASPITINGSSSETLSVGGTLTGKVANAGSEGGGEASVGWSRTISTADVMTTVRSNTGVGFSSVAWDDTYNHNPPFSLPNTSKSTYSADRLAIFELPRTINDYVLPAAGVPVVQMHFNYIAYWNGIFPVGKILPTSTKIELAKNWDSNDSITSGLPQFYLRDPVSGQLVTSLDLKVQAGKQTSFAVVANPSGHQEQLSWKAQKSPSFVTTNISPNGEPGNQTVVVNVLPNTPAGSVDYLLLNTDPPGGADSVRNGSLQVAITVAP